MEYDENIAGGAYRLINHVIFTHSGAVMFCDSAYLYPNNSLDAFNNVHINQGDTVNLYGKFLHYDGNTRIAEIRNNYSKDSFHVLGVSLTRTKEN